MGLKLSAILWRCFMKLSCFFEMQCSHIFKQHLARHLQVPTVNCQRYSNWHLHSSSTYWCYFALSFMTNLFKLLSLAYFTKNKLNKSASSMVFCLTRRLASSCNFNALILVNLIKCFCSKAISIWLHLIGRINLITRVTATCVRTSTTCS